MIPSREDALSLVHEYTENPNLRRHMYAVEAAMRAYAEKFGEDPELWALLEPLREDPFMRNIVDTHDPAFGYNSFEGIVDEDSAQALDQLVSERLGIAHDAARRWQHSDGGMHMLAAALYHAMKEDGFSETGGVYHDWLKLALQRGLLDPDDNIRRATEIVGEATVQKWPRCCLLHW